MKLNSYHDNKADGSNEQVERSAFRGQPTTKSLKKQFMLKR